MPKLGAFREPDFSFVVEALAREQAEGGPLPRRVEEDLDPRHGGIEHRGVGRRLQRDHTVRAAGHAAGAEHREAVHLEAGQRPPPAEQSLHECSAGESRGRRSTGAGCHAVRLLAAELRRDE
ncbi:hypothetical protein, partial [Brachybacterium paraconglomeratum]|uniref:hypothetical protein n=1 Tax=Brachybacterium paraconglomeratum TaxID=173362 RepID=UPI00223BE878